MKALPFPLVYDRNDALLYFDDSAGPDVAPVVAIMDDNADPETNLEHGQAITEAVNLYPALFAFVEQMARMTTPEDEFAAEGKEGDELRARYDDADEYRADLDDDRLCGEFDAFMMMIAEARKLLT